MSLVMAEINKFPNITIEYCFKVVTRRFCAQGYYVNINGDLKISKRLVSLQKFNTLLLTRRLTDLALQEKWTIPEWQKIEDEYYKYVSK